MYLILTQTDTIPYNYDFSDYITESPSYQELFGRIFKMGILLQTICIEVIWHLFEVSVDRGDEEGEGGYTA